MKIRKILFAGAAGISALAAAAPGQAQDKLLGQVFQFGGNFCPRNSMTAAGQLISISSNSALFSILGTTYGGNGSSNFALPNLQGRAVNHVGQGPGLSLYDLGQWGGAESVTMLNSNLPIHNHLSVAAGVHNVLPNTDDPTNASFADFPAAFPVYNNTTVPNTNMAPNTVGTSPVGGSQPIPVLNPYLTLQYCIVTSGIFPARN